MPDLGFNQVILFGRLCDDAKTGTLKSGVPFCTFTLAVETSRPMRGGDWKEETQYIDLQMFNAGGKPKYMTKGRQMFLWGRVECYKREGEQYPRTRIVIDQSIFTDNKPVAAGAENGFTHDPVYVEDLKRRNAELEQEVDRLTESEAQLEAIKRQSLSPTAKVVSRAVPTKTAQKRAITKRPSGRARS